MDKLPGFHLGDGGDGSRHHLELIRHPLPSHELLEKVRQFNLYTIEPLHSQATNAFDNAQSYHFSSNAFLLNRLHQMRSQKP